MRRLLPFREALVLKPRLPRLIEPSLLSNQSLASFAKGGIPQPPEPWALDLVEQSVHSLLTPSVALSRLAAMEVHLRPETESRLQELATKSGRTPNDLIEDAMAAYLQELAEVRGMLDSRYDDLKSGRVKPVDGEEAFANLRRKSKDDERRARS